ncbi:MAG TPA: LuxR C-terminal-related transcriptional regulator [Candidatus Acidoferrales bacterium]|nr:LuxR C-terminal-related transcriptional regulator [Candidatus Acidoferrales bacterium]
MNQREARRTAHLQQSLFRVQPKRFVFYDKGTGTERFEVKASADGSLPVDQAASLMAIHCFVRGKSPKDFGVMIAPEEDLLDGLLPVAGSLVQACTENRGPIQLSGRQREVLRAVMQEGSNKEIAAKLNISVRTVKFHMSALFEKFNVQSRVALMRKAADVLLPETSTAEQASSTAPSREIRLLRANGMPAGSLDRLAVQPLRMSAGAQRASR